MMESQAFNLITDCAKEICRSEGWFDGVTWALERLGKEFALSRVYLAENCTREDSLWQLCIHHEWAQSGGDWPPGEEKNRKFLGKFAEINSWLENLAKTGVVSAKVSDFPLEVRRVLGSVTGGTLMAAPVVVEGTQWGFLACYARQSERPWGSEEIAVLRAVAQMVAASIERSHKLRQRTKRREKLAELVEEIPEIFWVVDENTPKLLYASPSFERMWGCSRKEIASHPMGFLKRVHPEDRTRAEGAFDLSSLRKEVSSREERLRVLHPDGVTRWISMRYSILLGEDKGTGLIMGLATDITEHKQQERRWLTQRESLIREVHHRIKNHLQGLVGLLRQHIQHAPELAPPMEAAISQISAVAAIHGLQAINKGSQIRLGETVSAICNNASKITRCPIHFEGVALDAPLVIVESEAVPIALIINELVLNACKYRAASRAAIRVRVTANIPSKSAMLLIRNEGARLNKGFDFAAGKGFGTGLGLVKSLMPPLGAELAIEEQNGGVEAQLKLNDPVLQWTA